MIESHYGAHVVDAMDDLAAKAIIPLTTASAEVIDLPRQCAVAGGAAFGLMGRQRHQSEGNGRGLTPSQPDDRDSAPPGRSESSTGGGDRWSQIISPPPRPSVGVAGGPIGVYRPEDRLTPPAFRRAAGDITSPRTGSSSLPCPRRPHEFRGSTIPSRRSFFGFAPVAGAHCELTRQRAPLFPRATQKLAQCSVAWTLARPSTSPDSDHRCWRTALRAVGERLQWDGQLRVAVLL
jgi:hypothetical protein